MNPFNTTPLKSHWLGAIALAFFIIATTNVGDGKDPGRQALGFMSGIASFAFITSAWSRFQSE